MARFNALLVEDEPTSAEDTTAALNQAGFNVVHFQDAMSALTHVVGAEEIVDLLVLDRMLPKTHGEPASNDVGDELLVALLEQHTDLVAVVFSGHTGFEHHQFATADRGVISMRDGDVAFDRVRLFEKSQTIEFDQYLARLSAGLSTLEDIQVEADSTLTQPDRRMLRRVAYELHGVSIEARGLTGGLTGAQVWLCSIGGESSPTARVVVKRLKNVVAPGGFQTLCPAPLTAGTLSVVRGFAGGQVASVQQLAGDAPESLLALLDSDPIRAARVVRTLRECLITLPAGQRVNIAVGDIASPYGVWEGLQQRAADFGVVVPPGSRIATTRLTPQHGDLHPGNVLVHGDQPVLIDFDSQVTGSELLDAVALFLGPLFHADSPLRESTWPTEAQCLNPLSEEFLDQCPAPDYFRELQSWLDDQSQSPRELWAVLLAFGARQLRYGDVIASDKVRGRALSIVKAAAGHIDA